MLAVASPLDRAIKSLEDAAAQGAPARPLTSRDAVDVIADVEHARRLTAVVAVDTLQQIVVTRAHYDHGHRNARVMFAHEAGVSGSEAHRLDQIRRMINEAGEIAAAWRAGDLSVDKAALLGRAFANPRTRERFLLDQCWFLKKAKRFGMVRLTKVVARWLEVHDADGSPPDADPTHERRTATFVQDHFSKAWKLDASLGSMQGSRFNEILRAYLKAEFHRDWAQAEAIHGADTCHDLLPRTHNQRMADALCQMAEDAAQSDKSSASVDRVHNIVWTAEVYEELLRRWVEAPARILDPDRYIITDLDGHPLVATTAFADSLVSTLRRVVQNAAGVTTVRFAHLPRFLA